MKLSAYMIIYIGINEPQLEIISEFRKIQGQYSKIKCLYTSCKQLKNNVQETIPYTIVSITNKFSKWCSMKNYKMSQRETKENIKDGKMSVYGLKMSMH